MRHTRICHMIELHSKLRMRGNDMSTIIQVKNVRKTFAKKDALKDVSFGVQKGETFGLLGPSGAGKTTLIQMLTGQLKATSGDVHIWNTPIAKLKKRQFRSEFGVLSDNSGLYTRLSVYENLKLFCDLYDVPYRRIDEVLEIVQLGNEKSKTTAKLSRGMKQRVLLARTILHEPTLLFLDEPTSALDPVNTAHVHDGLRALTDQGTTILLTTHNMTEAEAICDRVAFLHEGEIKLLDTPKALQYRFTDRSITMTTVDGRTITIEDSPTQATDVYDYMKKEEIIAMHTNEPTLGDIFVQVTGRKLI